MEENKKYKKRTDCDIIRLIQYFYVTSLNIYKGENYE